MINILRYIYHKVGLNHFVVKFILYNTYLLRILTLINSFRWKKIRLYLIIWPPAINIFEEIKIDLSKECKIINYNFLNIPEKTFEDFVYELYKLDHASSRKISGKLKRLQVNANRIGIILVEVNKPHMIAHDCFNYVKCEEIGKIKFKLRNKYKTKIKNYIYDIIAHSTEADYQNQKVEELVKKYVLNYDNEKC